MFDRTRMPHEQILAAIPHRPPMLLLDQIAEWEQDRIVCRRTFHADEFFFQGHYPDFPLVPGVILCEAAMQAGAVLLSKHNLGEGVPVAGRLNDVKFKRMIRPGDTVQIEATLDERMGDAFFLSAKVTCEGKLAVTLSFAVTLARPA
jgi:3-hydroxyacyl-[acyl-carrier-protein] dehydratase